jgi:hypothetical protein
VAEAEGVGGNIALLILMRITKSEQRTMSDAPLFPKRDLIPTGFLQAIRFRRFPRWAGLAYSPHCLRERLHELVGIASPFRLPNR